MKSKCQDRRGGSVKRTKNAKNSTVEVSFKNKRSSPRTLKETRK